VLVFDFMECGVVENGVVMCFDVLSCVGMGWSVM
jgi:hypothetical protein